MVPVTITVLPAFSARAGSFWFSSRYTLPLDERMYSAPDLMQASVHARSVRFALCSCTALWFAPHLLSPIIPVQLWSAAKAEAENDTTNNPAVTTCRFMGGTSPVAFNRDASRRLSSHIFHPCLPCPAHSPNETSTTPSAPKSHLMRSPGAIGSGTRQVPVVTTWPARTATFSRESSLTSHVRASRGSPRTLAPIP